LSYTVTLVTYCKWEGTEGPSPARAVGLFKHHLRLDDLFCIGPDFPLQSV
jgi:hypothetical protein